MKRKRNTECSGYGSLFHEEWSEYIVLLIEIKKPFAAYARSKLLYVHIILIAILKATIRIYSQ